MNLRQTCGVALPQSGFPLWRFYGEKHRSKQGENGSGRTTPPSSPPVLWLLPWDGLRVEQWSSSYRAAAAWRRQNSSSSSSAEDVGHKRNPHTRRKQRILSLWSYIPVRKVNYSMEGTWIWGELNQNKYIDIEVW